MPRRRAVIVSSCEPCASARSKSRPLAQRLQSLQPRQQLARLAGRRAAAVMADHGRGHAVRLDQLNRLRVVARRDLDLVTLCFQQPDERPEDQRMRRRGQIDPDLHPATTALQLRVAANTFDVALVPERECEQAPHLAREVFASGDVIVEHARDGVRLQEALAADHVRARASRARTAAGRRGATRPPGSRSRASGRARPRPAAAARPPCAAAASSRGRAPCVARAVRTRSSRPRCP